MMKRTKRLPDKPSKMLQTLVLSLGILLLLKRRTLLKVSLPLLFDLFLLELLEKNRQKRPSLEETLQHPWFAEFKEIHASRTGTGKDANGLDNKFEAFTLTEVNSSKLTQDMKDL